MRKIIYACLFLVFCVADLLLYFLGGTSPGGGSDNSLFLAAIFLEIAIYGTLILLEIIKKEE